MRADVTFRSRRTLDKRFAGHDEIRAALGVPAGGWIRTVRNAIAMTLMDLSRRLEISHPAVLQLERREIAGDITIRKMHAVAAAMECDFVYVFLPKDSFEGIVQRRARLVARARGMETQEDIHYLLSHRGLWRKLPFEVPARKRRRRA